MTEDMVLLKEQFEEVRDLIEAGGRTERVLELLEELRVQVQFHMGMSTCWAGLFRKPTNEPNQSASDPSATWPLGR